MAITAVPNLGLVYQMLHGHQANNAGHNSAHFRGWLHRHVVPDQLCFVNDKMT